MTKTTTTTMTHRIGIEIEQRGRVLLARLHGGPRGEFGPGHAAELAALVTRAETDAGVGAVVITGTHPERFVGHAELPWLQEAGAASPRIGPARRIGGRSHGQDGTSGSRPPAAPPSHAAQRRDAARQRARDAAADEPVRRGIRRSTAQRSASGRSWRWRATTG